jgi:hypothetical protein
MDLSKLSTGDKIVVGSGLAFFVFMFFPWFTVDLGPFGDYTENGWDYFFTGIVPMLLGLAMVAWIVVTKLAEVDLPEIPIPEGLLLLILGGAAALLVVMRLLVGGDDDGTDVLDRSFGLLLATLAAAGLAAGAFMKFQESGGELPGKGSSGDRGTPTPF